MNNMKLTSRIFTALAMAATLMFASLTVFAATSATPDDALARQQVARQVRKELVTLPWTGVFDNLAYKVEGSSVTLYGQVVRPTTRSGAESRVKRIEGVERVINNIEVLPLSPFDDRIRQRAYYTIFNTGSLYRYAMGANPSLRIIVNRGRVTLEGVVANEGDRRLAYIAARTVPGVFEVTNNLGTDRDRRNS